MGFLKRLLGLEKKEEPQPIQESLPESIPAIIGTVICEQCGLPIPDVDIQTIAKKKFHKRCLRRLRKEAKRMAF